MEILPDVETGTGKYTVLRWITEGNDKKRYANCIVSPRTAHAIARCVSDSGPIYSSF